MKKLVDDSSILLKIWGTTDITLFIFAGASAEFAINKQVDWLFFTGKLPADPIGRLFSTVSYAQQIIFSEASKAGEAIHRINTIHHGVESARGRQIPKEAYKDVLYMLIYFSITAYELLEKKLSVEEKNEILQLFSIIGDRMHLETIPANYNDWVKEYREHQKSNLEYSVHSEKLFREYRKNLGFFRYYLLKAIQVQLVSDQVKQLMPRQWTPGTKILLEVYKLFRKFDFHKKIIRLLIPEKFKQQFGAMEQFNKMKTSIYNKPATAILKYC